jgi:hypothetical protein
VLIDPAKWALAKEKDMGCGYRCGHIGPMYNGGLSVFPNQIDIHLVTPSSQNPS